VAVTLTNSAEGITPSGTTLTAGAGGNTGGASGNFLDAVNIGTAATLASDSSTAAHGSLSIKCATAATAGTCYFTWAASLASVAISQSWYRWYFNVGAAYPTAGNPRVLGCLNTANALSGSVRVNNTTGTLTVQNSANAVITGMTTTNAVPLNSWCRIEGYFNSATGVAELKLFLSMDSATATETLTSAGAQSLGTDVSQYRFGQSGGATANYGPFWWDDLGASDTAYVGSALPPALLLPQRLQLRRPPSRSRYVPAAYGR